MANQLLDSQSLEIQPEVQLEPSALPPEYQPEPYKKSAWPLALIIAGVIVLFLIIGAVAGYYLLGRIKAVQAPAVTNQSTTTVTATVSSTANQVSQDITWLAPQELPALMQLFSSITPENLTDSTNYGQAYLVGQFKAGKYQGADLILLSRRPEGLSMYPGFFRFVRQGEKYTLLSNNSEQFVEDYLLDATKFAIDNDYLIRELNAPEILLGPKGEKLVRDQYVNVFFDINNLKLSFNDGTYGNVYTTNVVRPNEKPEIFDRNGFYLRLSDGTTAVYKLSADMLNESVAPKITWSDGKANTQTYSYTDINGCGSYNYVSVALINEADLVKIGTTAANEAIMAPKDNQNSYYRGLYNDKYQVYDDEKKVAYNDFIAARPLFFWRDSFGRLIKFTSTKFQPMAECGKPVIYLYPLKTTKVSVKLEPQGGFSYTEPAYNNGWQVMAEPSGQLTDLSSGQTYPYLFWEGRGGVYASPERGFVVKKAEVKSLLIDKLSQYHLNEQEIKDFLEFWLPRMQAKPYYFISFLGTREMDRLAPLTISPKPDTIIRVLMDFTPLDYPQPAHGYEISAPERSGFTVIEWGGVLGK